MATRAPLEIPPEEGPDRDRALVRSHVDGDPTAFQHLVRRHYQSMLGHAYRRLRDERAAEDAVQEALLRAYRSLGEHHADYRLGPWLHRILANVCTDEGLRRRREVDLQQRLSAELVVLPRSEPAQDDLAYVTAAIDALPDNYREVLVLRDVLELDYADVADRAGISEENARARVSRARAALRKLVATTVTLGILLGRFLRRGATGTPRLIREVSTAAATMPPEAMTVPARSVGAASTLAMTAVAVATISIPALVRAPQTAPTPAQQGSGGTAVVSGPNTRGAQAVVAVAAASQAEEPAADPALTSSTTSTTIADKVVVNDVTTMITTTTTSPRPELQASNPATSPGADYQPAFPSWTGAPIPAPSGPAIPVSNLSGPGLQVTATNGSDDLSGPAVLGWTAADASGSYAGSLAVPPSACGTLFSGTLSVPSASGTSSGTLHLVAEIDAAQTGTTATTYGFVGQATASGIPGYAGAGWVRGTVKVYGDHADVVAQVWGRGEGDAPTGPAPCATQSVAPASPSGASGSAGSSGSTTTTSTTVASGTTDRKSG